MSPQTRVCAVCSVLTRSYLSRSPHSAEKVRTDMLGNTARFIQVCSRRLMFTFRAQRCNGGGGDSQSREPSRRYWLWRRTLTTLHALWPSVCACDTRIRRGRTVKMSPIRRPRHQPVHRTAPHPGGQALHIQRSQLRRISFGYLVDFARWHSIAMRLWV